MAGKDKHQRQRSIFFPILLITLGVVFLARNLNFIPGTGWDFLVKMWPALLIMAGLDDLIRRQGIAWPVLLVGAGTLLLINNYGPRTLVTWSKVVQLWPLVIIALGVDLLFRTRTWWTTVISIILVIAIVGGAVWWLGFQRGVRSRSEHTLQHTLAVGTEEAEITLEFAAGQLIVGKADGEDVLAAGTAYPGKPRETYHQVGDRAIYKVDGARSRVFSLTTLWEMGLASTLPLQLDVENGAGELFLALDDLQLEGLEVSQGAGDMVIRLPAESTGKVSIEQAVGRVQIVVPAGMDLVLTVDKALSVVEVPESYRSRDGAYRSREDDGTDGALEIHIEQAVGYIAILTSDG